MRSPFAKWSGSGECSLHSRGPLYYKELTMTNPIQKPMSGRDYRAHAEGVKSQHPSEIVTLKSGSVFKLRRPDLQGYVVTGRLPQSLLAEGLKAWKNKGVPNASTLGDEEIANSLVFMREVVHECCVKPKFVEFATKDDEIGAAD